MTRMPNTRALAGIVAVEVVAAALAWRDLAHRSDEQIRGSKTVWRMVIGMNPGNSLAYWAFGRRK